MCTCFYSHKKIPTVRKDTTKGVKRTNNEKLNLVQIHCFPTYTHLGHSICDFGTRVITPRHKEPWLDGGLRLGQGGIGAAGLHSCVRQDERVELHEFDNVAQILEAPISPCRFTNPSTRTFIDETDVGLLDWPVMRQDLASWIWASRAFWSMSW